MNAHGVANHHLRYAFIDVIPHVEPEPGGVQPHHLHDRGDDSLGVERLLSEHHLVCLDAGKVQDVRDERLQRLARGANRRKIVALDAVEAGVFQQLTHGNDAVQGRADLVRHVRKKFGLRIRCRLSDGRFPQSLQLSLPCVDELTNV